MKFAPTVLMCFAAFAASDVRSEDPPPKSSHDTRMIASHGHRIAFHVTPGRQPAIVLDAGGGMDSTYWDALVPELAKRTGREIITYDRAGFGASDEVKGPWSLRSATDDLAAGLTRLGATHGVILVAHSLAGEIATSLALQRPKWLAGAVLVDANVPEFFNDAVIEQTMAQYAPAVQAARAAPTSKEARQLVALADSFVETHRAFHKMAWPDAVPVVVIVSEKTPFEGVPDAAQWWRDAHAQFAKAGPGRRLVVADRSSHDVAHDRPDTIVQAVVDLAGDKR